MSIKYLGESGTRTLINQLKSRLAEFYDKTETDTAIEVALSDEIAPLAETITTLNQNSETYCQALEVDEDGLVWLLNNGQRIEGPYGPFAGGGGGGGGSSVGGATMRVSNTTGWLSNTVVKDAECKVSMTWSSIEDDMPTGDGTVKVSVNGVLKSSRNVAQGAFEIDVAPYLATGTNMVQVALSDVYGTNRKINYTITVIELSISSTFDTTATFSGKITFPYTPVGAATKTIHFILDGTELDTLTTSASNRQLSYVIPQQSHGVHVFECYFDATINGQIVTSNRLYYEITCINEESSSTIISSSFNQSTVTQYTTLNIPYRVYTPSSSTSAVTIKVNGETKAELTVDRSEQVFTYRPSTPGTLTILFTCGDVNKTITLTVEEAEADVHAETQDLALYLNAISRSNAEADPSIWQYNNIKATLTGFNYIIDGWQQDDEGIDVLRVDGDARVTIPYNLFGTDFKSTGKTIEIEFATRQVSDYTATIISCFSDGIGLQITPQMVTFSGAQTSTNTLYKENEHITLSIVVEKQNENRLILVYINGIMSRAIQYASGERFSQLTPVGISIGSDDCGVDIYKIRVYDNSLSREQILDNWIADTQDGPTMLERYNHNDVYDEYGSVSINKLPKDLPYMILECDELPQYKGDKKSVKGSFTDPVDSSMDFTFDGCEMDVQGTSSAPYFRKNFDMKFKGCGFDTASGNVPVYALRKGSIPFNRFVIKADVASSESTNNTGLTMFYNDTCPYKTREMLANSKVRHGIEGIPIVVYWHDTANDRTYFWGKYNFNLPKRANTPLGYSGEMQSWEWQRNNSPNVKFQASDFTTEIWDEEAGQYKPLWYDDFEARFPEDTWRDYTQLKEILDWVVSTDRTKATNNALSSPVSYTLDNTLTLVNYSDDTSYTVTDAANNKKTITFTKDTPAYRLTKFKAECGDRFEMQSAYFYYLFTELFLMIDSRAKNMFIGFKGSDVTLPVSSLTRKAVFEPYDMDTAIGTNNSGVLMFGYYLEDTDHVSSIISGGDEGGTDAPVFNAQDSVFWMNLRDSSRPELMSMYRTLRSGAWSYSIVETMFENHQAKWPEAIFNEDAYAKYLTPLVEAVTVDEETGRLIKTDRYLTMLQGSKAEQRKWWLNGRFRYIDSKYNTGDAANKYIYMRLFNNGTLTITPAIDMYVGASFGGGSTPNLKRTTANTPVSFPYQMDTGVTEMETWVYSADLITDVGDLAPLFPNELDFSRATRIKNLKIGDASPSYSNANFKTLDVRNSALLETIDVRNCPQLTITVNLEGSPKLKEAYFDGTAITGVDLVDGGVLETLHLPATITTLTLMNQNKLTDLQIASYSNVSRLMLKDMNQSVLNPLTVLRQIRPNAQVYISGLELTLATAAEIEEFLDLLDTMQGVDREKGTDGSWVYHTYDTAQVAGVITTGSLTGAQVASYNERYPYLEINAEHIESTLTYMNFDGTQTIKTVRCLDGVPQESGPSGPTRESTAQYNFTFVGWSRDKNAEIAQSDAASNVKGDRTIYAAYTKAIRSYTVTWKNKGTTLKTDTVEYGVTPSYSGSTPTYQGQTSTGWEPAISPVTGNITYNATYLPVYTVTYYNDATVIKTEQVTQGANGVPPTETPTKPGSNPGDYEFMGWNPLPNNVQANMSVYAQYKDNRSVVVKYLTNVLDKYETTSNTTLAANAFYNMSSLTEVSGPLTTMDSSAFSSASNLTKVDLTGTSPVTISTTALASKSKLDALFIRSTTMSSMSSTNNLAGTKIAAGAGAIYVPSGLVASYKADSVWKNYFIASIDDYPVTDFSTITDSWEQIFANETDGSYANKYHVGDTKKITINGVEDYMQIVAMEADDLADGSGKAKITWLSKGLFTTHKMNDTSTNANGWAQSVMRTWLRETILPTLNSTIQSNIKEVTKTYYDKTTTSTLSITDTVWIPSVREIYGGTSCESAGCDYTSLFNSDSARIKYNTSGSANSWWLRSARSDSDTNFRSVSSYGYVSNTSANIANGVALGFST